MGRVSSAKPATTHPFAADPHEVIPSATSRRPRKHSGQLDKFGHLGDGSGVANHRDTPSAFEICVEFICLESQHLVSRHSGQHRSVGYPYHHIVTPTTELDQLHSRQSQFGEDETPHRRLPDQLDPLLPL